MAGSQGIEHELLYIKSATTHTLDDVFCRTLGASDDMHLCFQTDATHTNRFFDIMAIDHKFLWFDQKQSLISGNVNGLGGFNYSGDIGR